MKKRHALFLVLCFNPVLGIQAQSFSFSGRTMSSETAEGRERTVLRGEAEIISESTVIRAEEIQLFGSEFRFSQANGDVTIIDEDRGILIRTSRFEYDRQRKVGRVPAYVELEDQRNEVIVRGGYLESWEEEDIIIIQVGVRLIKEDMICRAEFARYDRGRDILELSGNPRVIWQGDEYQADRIRVNLETNEIEMDGRVRGQIRTGSEEGEEDTGAAAEAEVDGEAAASAETTTEEAAQGEVGSGAANEGGTGATLESTLEAAPESILEATGAGGGEE